MQREYTTHSRLAIAVATSATVGALAILLAQPIAASLSGDWSQWRLDHFLLPLIVGITIAAGHLCAKALRHFRILPSAGFALIFTIGTILTVYSSVGAQRATVDLKRAEAEAANRPIAAKQADLDRAKQRLELANTMADREMTGERCGRRCTDWRLRAQEVDAHIAQMERQLASLGTERVVAPGKARPFAEAMAVFGFDRDKVELIARTFEPFAYSLLFELTAIVAFGYGFGGRPAQPQTDRTNVVPLRRPEAITERDEGEITETEIGDVKRLYPVSEATLAAARLALANEPGLSNDELASRIGKSPATASKAASVLAAEGSVTRAKVTAGDCRRVAIA